MSTLSLIFRLLSVLAAAVTVFVYVIGGQKIKSLEQEVENKDAQISRQQVELTEQTEQFESLRKDLDSTTLELAELKRGQRIRSNREAILQNELDAHRSLIESLEADKLALAEQNETLRRENIDLKADSFGSQGSNQPMLAKIESQESEIQKLETALRNAELVLEKWFQTDKSNGAPMESNGNVRIQKISRDQNLMVLEAGAKDGFRENLRLDLLRAGNIVARVRIEKVSSDLCVANILPDVGSPETLKPGTSIEYTLSS